MSGETAKQESGWTTDTQSQKTDAKISDLEKYLTQRMSDLEKLMAQRFIDNDKAIQAALMAQEKAVAAALTAAKEAVLKAETASEKRFESVNEFRGQLADQTSTFLPRPEYDANHKALEDKILALTDRINIETGSKNGSELTWGKVVALVGVVGTILGIVVLLANGVFK